MSQITHRGRYYEEFHPGDEFITAKRTVFQSDIIAYAGLTGDWNPMHTDAEFAGQSQYGQIIAHGPLTFAIGLGLITRMGTFDGTGIAYLEAFHKCTLPVFAGDTLQVRMEVIDCKETSKKDRGIVSYVNYVINQKGEVVQEQRWKMLMKKKPQ